MQSIFFHVAMEPKGAPRPRVTRDGRAYMPAGYVKWKEAFAEEAARSMPCATKPWWPEQRLELHTEVRVRMPKSWSHAKQRAELGRGIAQRPDVDNCQKSIMDALIGVAYTDDSQIYAESYERRWTQGESYIAVQLKCEDPPNDGHDE